MNILSYKNTICVHSVFITCEIDLRLNMSVTFSAGELFPNYETLISKIDQYQRSNHVQIYRRDSRNIEKAAGRCPNKFKNLKPALDYTELTFSWIHGGIYVRTTHMR